MYSVRAACAVLGISSARLRSYLRGGLVTPTRNSRGQIRLTFQDLVFLRKAEGLVSQRIPPRRVHSALRALAERDINVAELRLCRDGQSVIVHDGDKRWDAVSGQALLDLEAQDVASGEAEVIPLTAAKTALAEPTPPRP
jgi:DNA-binding transcriptional MerR regulator